MKYIIFVAIFSILVRLYLLQRGKNVSIRDPEHDVQTILVPRCEKTGLRGFRPGATQTGLCSHSRWLEA